MGYMKSALHFTHFNSLVHQTWRRHCFWSIHEAHDSLGEAREGFNLAFNFTFLLLTAIWI